MNEFIMKMRVVSKNVLKKVLGGPKINLNCTTIF